MKKNIEELVDENGSGKILLARDKADNLTGYLYAASIILPFIGYVAYGVSGLHKYFPDFVDVAVISSPIAGPMMVSLIQDFWPQRATEQTK